MIAAAGGITLNGLFNGAFPAIVLGIAGVLYEVIRRQREKNRVTRLGLDQMVVDIHAALVTAPATDLNPFPPLGLVDQVAAINKELHPNGGTSLRDDVVAIKKGVGALAGQLVEHTAQDERRFTQIDASLTTAARVAITAAADLAASHPSA